MKYSHGRFRKHPKLEFILISIAILLLLVAISTFWISSYIGTQITYEVLGCVCIFSLSISLSIFIGIGIADFFMK